jgi:hypothetical protein
MEAVQANQAYLKKLKVAQTVVILNLQSNKRRFMGLGGRGFRFVGVLWGGVQRGEFYYSCDL